MGTGSYDGERKQGVVSIPCMWCVTRTKKSRNVITFSLVRTIWDYGDYSQNFNFKSLAIFSIHLSFSNNSRESCQSVAYILLGWRNSNLVVVYLAHTSVYTRWCEGCHIRHDSALEGFVIKLRTLKTVK